MSKRSSKSSRSASQRRPSPAMPAATNSSADRRLTNALIMGAVASLIVLGAIFLPDWLKDRDEAAEAENDNAEPTEAAFPDPLFPNESTATVTSFTLTNAETNEKLAASLNTDTLEWAIDEAPTDPESGQVVDTARIQQAVYSLPSMTPTRELDVIQALTQYGLDTPALLLEFTSSAGETHEIEIGSQNPGGSAYYVRVDGSDTVYLMPSYIFDPLIDMFTTPPYAEPTPTLEPTEPAES